MLYTVKVLQVCRCSGYYRETHCTHMLRICYDNSVRLSVDPFVALHVSITVCPRLTLVFTRAVRLLSII